MAEKILHFDNLPKDVDAFKCLLSIIGPTSIVTAQGDHWRKLRKMFNPAFSSSQLESLVPGIIQESLVFVGILNKAAESGHVLTFGDRIPVSALLQLY